MLSCQVAVCVHVHERWECDDLDQTLCVWDTFQVSRDALHVNLVAVSGTEDLSLCFLHAVHDVGTLLTHVQQLSLNCPVHGSFLVLQLDAQEVSDTTWTSVNPLHNGRSLDNAVETTTILTQGTEVPQQSHTITKSGLGSDRSGIGVMDTIIALSGSHERTQKWLWKNIIFLRLLAGVPPLTVDSFQYKKVKTSRRSRRVMAWARKIVDEGAANAHNWLVKHERPEMIQAELIGKAVVYPSMSF